MKKNKIIIALFIIAVLAFVFWWGGNAPTLRGWDSGAKSALIEQTKTTTSVPSSAAPKSNETETPAKTQEAEKQDKKSVAENKPVNSGSVPMTEETKKNQAPSETAENHNPVQDHYVSYPEENVIDTENIEKDEYQTEPVTRDKPVPIEPQNAVITDKIYTCTLSVRCDTILDNMAWIAPEKAEIIPLDGIILTEQEVTFYEGESVFNLLKREMKKNKIHFEFVNTPIYNSAYIEGIANIYEFDCGELSGWLYKVNGWFPNYGCSRYQLKEDDKVEWVYTCDLGNDVGGYFELGGGQKDE